MTANEFIEQQLDERIDEIEKEFGADAVSLSGPLLMGVDDVLRTAVERRSSAAPRRDRLAVILTTSGGFVEVVQRIVDTLRRHYEVVEFVVPNYAYSAGTVRVMLSGRGRSSKGKRG